MSVPYSYRDLKVSNVKISFKLKEKIDFNLYHDNYLLYDHKTLKICKFDQYTATFMGKNHTFVNVTGLKSFCDIIRSKQLFCDEFNIRLTKLYDVKIDTISGVFNIPKFSLHNILKKLTYHNYKITKFSHFCGVKVVLNKSTFMLFNSGKATSLGSKNEISFRTTHQNIMKIINCMCDKCM